MDPFWYFVVAVVFMLSLALIFILSDWLNRNDK